MKKQIVLLLISVLFFSCTCAEKPSESIDISAEKEQLNTVLDTWHLNAAEANFDAYFDAMSNQSVFVGTDVSKTTKHPPFFKTL